MTKELEGKIYLGNYIQDQLGQWWRKFPDGQSLVSEEISDLLNFHKAKLEESNREAVEDFADWFNDCGYVLSSRKGTDLTTKSFADKAEEYLAKGSKE